MYYDYLYNMFRLHLKRSDLDTITKYRGLNLTKVLEEFKTVTEKPLQHKVIYIKQSRHKHLLHYYVSLKRQYYTGVFVIEANKVLTEEELNKLPQHKLLAYHLCVAKVYTKLLE